jgi:phenylacetate-CoA ligase
MADKDPGLLRTALDLWSASHGRQAGIAARQKRRPASLIAFARERSPFYARLYGRVAVTLGDMTSLPPVQKPELMAAFDDWVTDSAVRRAGAEAFAADRSRVGEPYLERWRCWPKSRWQTVCACVP